MSGLGKKKVISAFDRFREKGPHLVLTVSASDPNTWNHTAKISNQHNYLIDIIKHNLNNASSSMLFYF